MIHSKCLLTLFAAFLCLTTAGHGVAGPPTHSDAPAKAVALPPAPPLTIAQSPLVDMVRALKATQDRLALGDERALKASQEHVNTILDWFENAPAQVWLDRRNVRALAVFLLGGGSIGAARSSLNEATIDPSDRSLINSVLAYAEGRFDEAQELMSIDALKLEPLLGAHVALAQATLLTGAALPKAFDRLTQSTLLAPGTLIEEAALRRQIVMATANRGIGSLTRVVELYTRRFPKSVYRRGLVDSILNSLGPREFESKDDILGLTAALSSLSKEERTRIGLFLAEGQIARGRLEWAREMADQVVAFSPQGSPDRVRAQLYRAVSGVFELQPGGKAAVFDTIDLQKLPASDDTLLRAAMEVARAVTAAAAVDPSGLAAKYEVPLIVTRAQVVMTEVDKLLQGG